MPENVARILIIDDQPDSVALLLSYLEDKALDILVALDGRDGLSKAAIGQPDLILLDVTMPHLDGFATCKQLKQDVRTERIPVIFLSGRDTLDHKLEGFTAGAIDYIIKPFSEAEVLARIMVHIHAKQRLDYLETVAGQRVREGVEPRQDLDETLFARAIGLLEKNLREPPGMVELAHRVGTNERKLTQIFRRKVGMTVFDFLVELRLETARRLLEGSGLQIQLIADRVGYRNAGDFTRAFRRRYGASPREYRQALGVPVEEPAASGDEQGASA
jgi:YesN/AraC family two-component response regulator